MGVSPAKRRPRKKPLKPNPSFPLTPHNNGQWCKKIRGKIHFFGIWENPQAAFENYLRVATDLHAGRQPTNTNLQPNAFTVKDACNHYLTFQYQKVQNEEIRPGTFEDCRHIAESLVRAFGSDRLVSDLTPADFQKFRYQISQHGLTRKGRELGAHALTRVVTTVKSLFKYAYNNDLIEKPIKFGTGFERPSVTVRRKSRMAAEAANGKKLFTPDEIRSMLEKAGMPLRVMILLGINGALGNSDCSRLPVKAVDLERAIIEFNRPKTGAERVVPLWPETVNALREVLASRPTAASPGTAELVFLTKFGHPWVRETVYESANKGITKVVAVDSVGQEFNKLLTELGLKRKGIGFYTLRHTFRTWADEAKDQHAIHRIMGHTIPGMSGVYVEEISLERLRAVVDLVHAKLFPPPKQEVSPTTA